MKKLSAAQQRVVDLMRDGWELGLSGGIDPRAWLQRDGLGRSGPTEDVNLNTFFALQRGGVIARAGAYGLGVRYGLDSTWRAEKGDTDD